MLKKFFLYIVIVFFITASIYSQNIKSMEFHNQKLSDILLSIAEISETSIIPDETVEGTASFYFSDSSLENILDLFTSSYNLFYSRENNSIYKVSKIKASVEENLVSIKADNVKIEHLIRHLSSAIGKTILYDTLPSLYISVDIEKLSPGSVLEICIKKLPDFEIESSNDYFYIKRISKTENTTNKKNQKYLQRTGDLYSLSLEKGRFLDVIQNLFSLAQIEYSIFVQSDSQLENLYFENKDFETMLRLILEHGNADYINKDNIFYIIDLQRKNINAKLKTTELIPLAWIQAQEITNLLPSELSAGSIIRIDKTNNIVLLTGTTEEIQPIKNFISQIDIPLGGLEYEIVSLKYLDAKEIISLVPSKITQTPPVVIPGTNKLLATGTKETLKNLNDFIERIDIQQQGTAIKLKYIQVEDLLKNLPPSITKDYIIDSGYPNVVFFKGSNEKLQLFLKELDAIDRPKPQIRYQLLVIQYTKNDKVSINPSSSITKIDTTDSPSFLFNGSLSNIMDLSFDVISNFGYKFAANLNTQIEENTANIFTDTTLTALSGQEVKFQNTDTYRYVQYDYDSSSNTKTGSTQSITSGLLVGINGWISGDNMITMTVNATISKQNSTSSSSSNSTAELPSTSERVVTTQVRSPSGEPVIISGLLKEDENEHENRHPILGKIPLIKYLFKQNSKSKEKTEIVIYIVPHLIQDSKGNLNDSLLLERYYNTLVRNNNGIN